MTAIELLATYGAWMCEKDGRKCVAVVFTAGQDGAKRIANLYLKVRKDRLKATLGYLSGDYVYLAPSMGKKKVWLVEVI